jgi:hypothetical protein
MGVQPEALRHAEGLIPHRAGVGVEVERRHA